MLRRELIAMAGAAAGFGLQSAAAQVAPPAGYGTPVSLVPFGAEVFAQRRKRVMEALKTGVAVIYGAKSLDPANALELATQQEDNFAWLTGIVDEPGAVLVLAPEARTVREFLYLPSREPEAERWNVERLPLGAEIERRTGFERVARLSALEGAVTGLAHRYKELRFLGPIVSPSAPLPPALELYSKIGPRVPGTKTVDDSDLMASLRIVKEPRELALMRKAMDATRAGHLAAMRSVKPGMTERDLKLILEAAFRTAGGQGLAYESIVGAGRNAASLHYTAGGGVIRDGDLILIDAAASVGGYACDVTRTFPANGKFTAKQRQVYEVVLAAQEAAMARCKAGAYLEDMTNAAKDVIRKAGHIDDFYHGLSHFVGVDVHDAGDNSKPLPAGAVITIEPGVYVQAENFGIRIEDQFLITETGCERMSVGVPRTVAEIEAAMAGRAR